MGPGRGQGEITLRAAYSWLPQKEPEAYLVRDEREMALIGEAYHRRYVKGEQLRTIWQDFKKRGERTTRGTPWTENRLYRAIRQWKECLETGEPF